MFSGRIREQMEMFGRPQLDCVWTRLKLDPVGDVHLALTRVLIERGRRRPPRAWIRIASVIARAAPVFEQTGEYGTSQARCRRPEHRIQHATDVCGSTRNCDWRRVSLRVRSPGQLVAAKQVATILGIVASR
jgi:hypothetical protein